MMEALNNKRFGVKVLGYPTVVVNCIALQLLTAEDISGL
jgi:hypothetical protein